MSSFGPTSSAPISALPDWLLNDLSITFAGTVTYEAVPYSPYIQLLTGGARLAYALELSLRAVR